MGENPHAAASSQAESQPPVEERAASPFSEGGFESDYASESSQSSYGRHHRKRSPAAKRFRDGKLLVHRDFSGQIPLCFYATGLESGGSHDYYECFDERDILWARRVRFHIDRLS